MKPSTGKDHHAAKTSEFSFYKKKYENFKVKIQKVPPVCESKRYTFLKAFWPIYISYLAKFAVQPRTGTDFYENVISAFYILLVFLIVQFKQRGYQLKA